MDDLPDIAMFRDKALDEKLLAEWKEKKRSNHKFQKMLEFRAKLPSFQMKEVMLGHL